MPDNRTNELLGYPSDARVLIVNADDFGMYRGITEAIFRTLKEGVVRSTSLMVPCPFAVHAMHLLRENPDLDFGIHLTVIRDRTNHNWGPLTPRDKVPSILDESGCFYTLECLSELLAGAKLDELEMEFRAQIEAVLAGGLKPTHLDWHCLHNGGRADILDLTVGLAKEYGLAVRVFDPALVEKFQSQGLPTGDFDLLDSFRLDTTDKAAGYIQMLHELPAGLSQWAVHPGWGDADAQAQDPGGWLVRQTDFEFLISPEAGQAILQEGIILLGYKAFQKVWQSK